MIPENPVATPALVIFSRDTEGRAVITCGGVECVYPRPGFTSVVAVTTPFVMDAVAVAVVPIPTPIACGDDLETVIADPTYPLPPFVIESEDIVPAADTT